MSDDDFMPIPKSGEFDFEASLGHLLVVDVLEYLESIRTVHGDSAAVRVNIVNVDDPDLSAEGALIFPKVLVGNLSRALRDAEKANKTQARVLGRLAQGAPKPGQSAPWILEDAMGNPEDVKRAQAALRPVAQKASPRGKAAGPIPF
jgi:hypothetical protein